jgi:1,5-anhydro-D-fructose reductase (1,5-anhydro-D-mannitol-forming)
VAVRIKEIVDSGELGKVVLAKADFVYDARLTHRGWLLDRKIAGGGPVFDIGVHCLDTLRFVLQDEVVSVKSELDPRPDAQQTESTALLTLRFSRGTIGSIFCSYNTSIRKASIDIIGTEGTLSAEGFTQSNSRGVLNIQKGREDKTAEKRKEKISVPNLYVEEISQFSDSVKNNREPVLSGLNGLQNQRVLDAVMA